MTLPRPSDSRLHRFYSEYEADSDLGRLLARIYDETRIYCIRRLNSDPDVVADFLLHFFEHSFERLVAEFRRRNHPSFPGFYLVSVRNSFANFMRTRRRRSIPTVPLNLSDDDPVAGALIYHCGTDRLHNRLSGIADDRQKSHPDLWGALEIALSHLDGIDPILFKMYHNIPLNIEELRTLVGMYGIEKSTHMLHRLEHRHNHRIDRLEVIRRRMDRYASRRMRGESPAGQRKRESYRHTYQNRHWTHSVQGLAAMLEMSKQLASFRLRKTTKYLREALVHYGKDLRTEEAG